MDNVREKVLFYHLLPPEDQVAIEVFVQENPEWQPVFEEANRLADLVASARQAIQSPDEEEALAYLLATRYYSKDVPRELADSLEEMKARLRADPELRTVHDSLLARLEELEEASDAKKHFERLSGADTSSDDRGPVGRNSPAASRIIAPMRWVLAAVVAFLFAYGALFAISEVVTPDHVKLAELDSDELFVEGFHDAPMRSGERVEMESNDVTSDYLYVEALGILKEARSTTLGLFPRFDEQALAEAETLLEQVIEREDPNSFVQLDAYYFLGKVHLARGEEGEAQRAFQRVVRGEGRNAPQAADILQKLAADEAFDPSDV